MPVDVSHFSMAGFALDAGSEASFRQAAQKLIAGCDAQHIADADFVCRLADKSGGELWVGLRKGAQGEGEIVTINPAFAGTGRTEVEIAGDVSDPEERPFEITVSARFSGDREPLVFDLADPREASAFKTDAKLAVDISGFSFDPEVFADADAYVAAQKAHPGVVFAPNYFVPTGTMFAHAGGAMPEGAKRPVAYADLAGTIVQAALKTNALGGGRFWWISLKTYDDAVLDVVLDPKSLTTEPRPGNVVSGRFWLSARLAR
jgi:hypothetical protein